MDRKKYGTNFNQHILEQYKMYVEMADRVSARRDQVNRFYISIHTALISFITFLLSLKLSSDSINLASWLLVLIGTLLCILWYYNINSYKELNKLKFKVIHEMEQSLPFPCYDREWQIEKDKNNYIRLTRIEKYFPILTIIFYIGLILVRILN